MEGSFYNVNSLFVATKEPSVTFDPSLAPQNAQQQPTLGIYQEEESVDFSALVDACENRGGLSPITFNGSGSASGPLSSSSFFESAESAFPFENLMPGLSVNMYGSDSSYQQQVTPSSLSDYSTSHPPPPSASQPANTHHISSLPTSLPGTDPAPGKSKPTKQSSKKHSDKNSMDYREKRDRNNVAVRKSRIKSKQRVLETEKRVKELEDENGELQSKIALLTKELNVLKGLFASAGVPHPSVKMETDSLSLCRNSD